MPCMESRSLKISFPFVPGEDFNVEERYAFWDSATTFEWFKSRGYTLYERVLPEVEGGRIDRTRPSLPLAVDPAVGDEYPYAYHDTESDERRDGRTIPLLACDQTGKVAFAQDSFGRHVAIKIVRARTDELRILEFLSRLELDVLKENCVIPVLDFLPTEGFCFVVMPRWGSVIHLPPLQRLHEVVTVIHSTLKGLAFLHDHNITHGDLLMKNVLVNHFSDMESFLTSNNTRQSLRSHNLLVYALFDFDFSILFPPRTNRMDIRLPYQRSWGTFNLSNDTAAGEFDYNPFIFDVGTLGVVLCRSFQHLAFHLHVLAPLLDMMTTRHLDRRFTASEALQFFEAGLAKLSSDELNRQIQMSTLPVAYEKYDRWRSLPREFVTKWEAYRETPIPWTTEVLRNLCSRDYICHIVPWTRRVFFQVFSFPKTLRRWFLPSKLAI